ncbi:MAG: hypothetical protein FWD68_15140, partial [Alphaproteobacteria bacterium]|nr:hypothetical protein [Alphaproteobacteria bacterium]
GLRFALGWIGLAPNIAGQFRWFDLPGCSEQPRGGSSLFALDYEGRTCVVAVRRVCGPAKSIACGDGAVTLRGRLASRR